jgi:hypothetical protein
MKITLIAYKENSIHFFKEIAQNLSKNISGLVLGERFCESIDEIPVVAQEATEDSDYIFVFVVSDDKEEIKLLEDKLIDVELKTKTRIIKAIESDNFSAENEAEYDNDVDELSDKYSKIIVSTIFNENDFEPEERDFSL